MIVSQKVGICICFKRPDIVNPLLKTNVGRERRCNVVILECFNCCWEGGEVERWERWEIGELGRCDVSGFVQGWGTQGESKIWS